MVLKKSDNQLSVMLSDTILALCRNALSYRGKVSVEGLLGVTLDDEEIFLVNINEIIKKEGANKRDSAAVSENESESQSASSSEDETSERGSPRKRKRKRKRQKNKNSEASEETSEHMGDISVKQEQASNPGDDDTQDYDDDNDLVFVKSEPSEEPSQYHQRLGSGFSNQSHSVFHQQDSSQSGDFSQILHSAGIDPLQQIALQQIPPNSGQTSLSGDSPSSAPHSSAALQETIGRYECATCHKIFKLPSKLERHLRSHTGEKPYKCHVCSAGFTQSGNLYRHLKVHSETKNFMCNVCFLPFTQKANMKRHMLTHQEEHLVACGICGHAFYDKYALTRHMKDVHKGKGQDVTTQGQNATKEISVQLFIDDENDAQVDTDMDKENVENK